MRCNNRTGPPDVGLGDSCAFRYRLCIDTDDDGSLAGIGTHKCTAHRQPPM